jgi:hypothetical protein
VLEISRLLFLAGALPFVGLGLLHAWVTPRTLAERKGLSPRDAALREAMSTAHLFLTRRTTLWQTWVGFNFSHSLGAVLFGLVVLLIGRSPASFTAQGPVFLPFAILVSTTYLVIGLLYWFRTPNLGITLSLACFVASGLLFFSA